MNVNIRIDGVNKTIANLNKRIQSVNAELPKALDDISLDLLGKSKQLAPIDTGDLRGSGYLDKKQDLGRLVYEVGFSTEYALIQHENMDFKHPQGGEAKYLEKPLKENLNKYVNHIENAVKKAVD